MRNNVAGLSVEYSKRYLDAYGTKATSTFPCVSGSGPVAAAAVQVIAVQLEVVRLFAIRAYPHSPTALSPACNCMVPRQLPVVCPWFVGLQHGVHALPRWPTCQRWHLPSPAPRRGIHTLEGGGCLAG